MGRVDPVLATGVGRGAYSQPPEGEGQVTSKHLTVAQPLELCDWERVMSARYGVPTEFLYSECFVYTVLFLFCECHIFSSPGDLSLFYVFFALTQCSFFACFPPLFVLGLVFHIRV